MLGVLVLFSVGICFATTWNDFAKKPSVANIDGSEYYEISTPAELAWFSSEVESGKTDVNAILRKNIDLAKFSDGDTLQWNPIGVSQDLPFEGVFDGNGNVISGAFSVYKERNLDTLVNGFFRYVGSKGIVKNLTLENAIIRTVHGGTDELTDTNEDDATIPMLYSAVGGVVGYNEGIVENVSFIGGTVTPQGTTQVMAGATSGNIYIVNYIAGNVAGVNHGTVRGFLSKSPLYVKNNSAESLAYNIGYAGGVVGINTGRVQDGTNEGSVQLVNLGDVGGICGINYGTISNVYYEGRASNTEGYLGGIVGRNEGDISMSSVYGDLNSSGYISYVGGVAAYNNGSISASGMFQKKGLEKGITASVRGYTMMGVTVVKAEAYTGGVAAVQGPKGIIDNSGNATWLFQARASESEHGTIEFGGLVGLDSGSVKNSYAAYSTVLSNGTINALYHIIDETKEHRNNNFDSTYSKRKFQNDTTGLPTEAMRTPKFAWELNTKKGTVANEGVWTYDNWYPIIANVGRKPTYRVVRYVDKAVFDTVYTNYEGHAIWGDSVPNDDKGQSLSTWEYRIGSQKSPITSQHVFSSDTSIYAVMADTSELSFTVVFRMSKDSIFQKFENVPYGTIPEYTGPDTFRDSTGITYRYTFRGWDHEISAVTYDQVYTAVYDSSLRYYSLEKEEICGNWKSTTSATRYLYGTLVSCKDFYISLSSCSDSLNDYTVRGWDVNCDSFVIVSDTVIHTVYDTIPKIFSSSSKVEDLIASSSSEDELKSSSSNSKSSSSGEKSSLEMFAVSSDLSVLVNGRQVTLNGVKPGSSISVFDLQGNLVHKDKATSSTWFTAVERSGVYVVMNGARSIKVSVR